jgi:hypothetical protein
MTILVHYSSKKRCREAIGQRLRHTETSLFGNEYKDDGVLTVAYRPSIQHLRGAEWFGRITMKDGLIAKVE